MYMPDEKYMKLNVELSGRLWAYNLSLIIGGFVGARGLVGAGHRFALGRRFPLVQLLVVEALVNTQQRDLVARQPLPETINS